MPPSIDTVFADKMLSLKLAEVLREHRDGTPLNVVVVAVEHGPLLGVLSTVAAEGKKLPGRGISLTDAEDGRPDVAKKLGEEVVGALANEPGVVMIAGADHGSLILASKIALAMKHRKGIVVCVSNPALLNLFPADRTIRYYE